MGDKGKRKNKGSRAMFPAVHPNRMAGILLALNHNHRQPGGAVDFEPETLHLVCFSMPGQDFFSFLGPNL